ncbi:hypothetical protein GV64_07975 [Endozoicomonas elysicola]|uniref:Lipoprotein n=2 Tax=Endozoicomonas elysicola TaxID=305900 RepID=A0A081K957_9GAMM|nr:hypothetical protein GV64_07975 [Endozoicomonas elysicola]
MSIFKAYRFLVICILLTAFSQAEAESALMDFNNAFREIYASTRTEMAKQYKPLIVASPFSLNLIGNEANENRQYVFSSAAYTNLKSVSHIPLTIYVLLVTEEGRQLPENKKKELKRLITLIKRVGIDLPNLGFTEQQLIKQQALTQMSLDFARKILSGVVVDSNKLTRFVRNSRTIIDTNVHDAAVAQIDWLHQVVKPWYDSLSGSEKKALKVLILAPKEPRDGNLMTQYFSRLLGVKGEGMNIVYAENVFDAEVGMNVLGTFLLDTQIGRGFFDDSWRMHEDLLSHAAREYIQTLQFGL